MYVPAMLVYECTRPDLDSADDVAGLLQHGSEPEILSARAIRADRAELYEEQ